MATPFTRSSEGGLPSRTSRSAPVPALLAALTLLSACGGGTPSQNSQTAGSAPAAWRQCATCHALVPGKNGVGPSLAGVYGRAAGSEASYAYSSAMRASGLVWDDATLETYLADPGATVPGTKMAFAGIDDPAERAELVAYLKSL